MSRDFNEALVYSLLRDHPYLEGNPQAISALMGTIYDETGVTPEQAFDHTTTQKGNRGYGLFQFDWADQKNKTGGMRGAYNDWLKESDNSDSTESQINFAMDSMVGEKPYYDIGAGHRKHLRKAFAGKDTANILDNVTKRFERAGKPHQKRMDYALGFNPDNVMNVPHAAVDDYILDPVINMYESVADAASNVGRSYDTISPTRFAGHIARENNMSEDELQALNPELEITRGSMGKNLQAGQKIKVGDSWYDSLSNMF